MEAIQFIKSPGAKALAELDRLRAAFPATGLYPILLGDEEDKERVIEFAEEGPEPSETIEFSRTIDPLDWFEQMRGMRDDFEPEIGSWPARADKMGIVTHQDIRTRTPKPEVIFALLKISEPWEAFARLNYGGWNDCPESAVHCALHRYWAEKYGAEVVSVTGSIVQCKVSRPPTDKAESMKLAHEQYLYCYDIVEQGVQTISALAASVMNAPYWYFWWD